MGFAAYFLVVWDLIRFARESGIRVGPGRGSAAGCCVAYCLRDRGPRPDPLRPALRALPQPRPQADARHRHGLRRALPRRRHALRGREVRQRPRGPGRHLLDDQGAGRRARRGPGARQALHRRRPHRQGDAAARHGPRHPAARLPRPRPTGTRRATRRRPSCATMRDADPDAKEVIDVALGPRGAAAPGRHPRRRGGHLPRPAHRLPADPAQARRRARRPRTRRSSPSTRCTGSRTSGCSRWTSSGLRNLSVIERALDLIEADDGGAARHRRRRPRRRADARDAAAGRVDRRVPARGRGRCARP